MNNKTIKIIGYIVRSIWFVAKIAIVVTIVAALMILGYVMAKDIANVYIITTDGMKLRAGVVLELEDSSDLYKFFTSYFVANDSELSNTKYDDYIIRDYDYDIKVKSLWVNPWDKTAEVIVEESIPDIDGEKPAETEDDEAEDPPEWPSRRFKLTFVNEDDKWLINEIYIMEYLDTDEESVITITTAEPTATATATTSP